MAKKDRKQKKLFDRVEPFEPQAESTESNLVDPQSGAAPAESKPEEESVEVSTEARETSIEQPDSASTEASDAPVGAQEEFSEEDVLADVRQSLIEQESLEKAKQPKWWRRIAKGRKKEKDTKPAEQTSQEVFPLPADELPSQANEEQQVEQASEGDLEEIDELIKMLAQDTEEDIPVAEADEVMTLSEESPQLEHKVDIEELKKQAFQRRATKEEDENVSDVRAIALEGEEEVFVEVEAKPVDPLEERLKAFENAIQPYRRYINIAFVFLGVVMAVIAGLLLYSIYQQTQPEPTPIAVSNLPYPTSVSLPGGWSFGLGRGALQDGKWNPQGAEWLEGTEVCRWVALPWSRQLEAVIRTLNPDDPIELTMSNNDRFVYKVYSIRQLSSEEMLDLDSNSPCLLVVLADADSDSRWVLTALP